MSVQSKAAVDIDAETLNALKSSAEFNNKRRLDFKANHNKNKIFNKEREKGLSIYLEEQEKWEYLREKGIPEQKKERLSQRMMDEDSPEYRADFLKQKKHQEMMEVSRKKYVQTRDVFKTKLQDSDRVLSEEQELGLISEDSRPRYAVEKRARNKWLAQSSKNGTSGSSSSSAGSSGGYTPPPNDYVPPPPDFSSFPADSFEDLPPPPMPMPYEGNTGYNPNPEYFNDGFGNGGAAPVPQYRPPDGDYGWDF